MGGRPLWFSTKRWAAKYRDVLRRPQVGFLVVDPADEFRYVELRGTATVAADPGCVGRDRIRAKHGIGADAPDPAAADRVLVVIAPHHVVVHPGGDGETSRPVSRPWSGEMPGAPPTESVAGGRADSAMMPQTEEPVAGGSPTSGSVMCQSRYRRSLNESRIVRSSPTEISSTAFTGGQTSNREEIVAIACSDACGRADASPWPPPPHSAAAPMPPPRRRSSWSSVRARRLPLIPIGWPRAIAPPLTLTISSLMPRSAIDAMPTAANASLISNRSTSPTARAGPLERLADRVARLVQQRRRVGPGDHAVADDLAERRDAARARPPASTS